MENIKLQSEYYEDDDIDSNQSLYDSRRSADHTPTNNTNQVPEMQQSKLRQHANDPIKQFTKANTTNTPQWRNPDDDHNSERSGPLKLESYYQNGLAKSESMMEPLTVDVDEHAWDLEADHLDFDADQLDFQHLIGNMSKCCEVVCKIL